MKNKKIKLGFGTTITDIDLRNLTPGLCYNLYNLYASRKLLIIKNQKLNNEQLKAVASIFGSVWSSDKEKYSGLTQTGFQHESGIVELLHSDGVLKNGMIPWHVDLTHFPSQTLPNRLLYAVNIQGPVASTNFIDTVQGLKLLDKKLYNFLRNTSIHCLAPYKTPWKAIMRRPALSWHPIHKDWGLILDGLFTVYVEDMENYLFLTLQEQKELIKVSQGESSPIKTNDGILGSSKAMVKFVTPIIKTMKTEDTFYSHEWEENDLMIYDNWSLIHQRNEFDKNSTRKLKRITWDQNWHKYE